MLIRTQTNDLRLPIPTLTLQVGTKTPVWAHGAAAAAFGATNHLFKHPFGVKRPSISSYVHEPGKRCFACIAGVIGLAFVLAGYPSSRLVSRS